ncbi:MAG: hypothetical protein E7358_05330 [Clostridiales bacterium]|nr:hypothetical protein [Clostridiales bacterium]
MEILKTFFINCWKQIYTFYRETLVPLWPFQKVFPLVWVLLIALGVIVVIVLVTSIVSSVKPKKVKFFVNGDLIETIKVKHKTAISFPTNPVIDGSKFLGWATDKEGKNLYESQVLLKNKNLKLYANFEPISVVNPSGEQVLEPIAFESAKSSNAVEFGPKYFYDEIRYAMLGYERSMQFKKLGVQRKKIVAEMFEKDEVVYLYLAVDPSLMIEKGFKVEKYDDVQFEIVPCKKAVKTKEDLDEALLLVKEAMTVNNLIKSEGSFIKKPSSDEQARKSGFAFFIKNETVATSAEDYYRILRAIVLSYQKSSNIPMPVGSNNKMILKIYKKEELVYVYLALDPTAENLQNVSFDRNFLDTPAMIEIKTAEDFSKTNELIDKLMFRYGMERHPEKAVISMEDKIDSSCGFGYRIKN